MNGKNQTQVSLWLGLGGVVPFYHHLSRKPKRDKLVSLSNHDYIWIELAATFKAGRLVGDIELVRIDHEEIQP